MSPAKAWAERTDPNLQKNKKTSPAGPPEGPKPSPPTSKGNILRPHNKRRHYPLQDSAPSTAKGLSRGEMVEAREISR